MYEALSSLSLLGLLASHGNQGYALLETVVEFLSRKSNVIGLSSAPEMLGALAVKYSPTGFFNFTFF